MLQGALNRSVGGWSKCGRNAGGLGAGIRAVWAPGDFEYGISANLRMASYRVRSQMNMDLVRIV
jgi:hypothetical protein